MTSEIAVGYENESDVLIDTCCLTNYVMEHQQSTMGDPMCEIYNPKPISKPPGNNYLKVLYDRWNSAQLLRPSSPIFKGIVAQDDGGIDDKLDVTQCNSTSGEVKEDIINQTTFNSLSPVVLSKEKLVISTPSPLKRKLQQTGLSNEFAEEVMLGENKFCRKGSAPWEQI
jgi:hypothetical protein